MQCLLLVALLLNGTQEQLGQHCSVSALIREHKGREIIGCIVTVLVKMLSFDNTLGPMIRLTMLTLLEIR